LDLGIHEIKKELSHLTKTFLLLGTLFPSLLPKALISEIDFTLELRLMR